MERRRCSLTRRSERQAELETCDPPLKSARSGRCTRGAAGSAGRTPRARGPHTARFPAALSSPHPLRSFSWCRGAGLFTGKSREQERTRRLTPKPTGTTWLRGAGSTSRPALRSCETGAPGPAPGPTWGPWGSGRPPHTTAPEGQGWGAEVTLRLKGLVKSSVAASFLMANAQS